MVEFVLIKPVVVILYPQIDPITDVLYYSQLL